MNNTLKKTLATILTVTMLATATTLLSSCKANTTTDKNGKKETTVVFDSNE